MKGFHATSMAEIGEAVNVGRGALYYHIRSKADLLVEISSMHVEHMITYAESIAASPLSAEDKLRAVARQLMQTISNNLPALTVFFREVNSFEGEHRVRMWAIRDRFEAAWILILDEGVADGTFEMGDRIVGKGLLGMFNYSYLWLNPRGRLSATEIADAFVDMALKGLLRRPNHRSLPQVDDGT